MFLRPSLHIASQCARDSGEAAGEVSSMYSTPNSSSLRVGQLGGFEVEDAGKRGSEIAFGHEGKGGKMREP